MLIVLRRCFYESRLYSLGQSFKCRVHLVTLQVILKKGRQRSYFSHSLFATINHDCSTVKCWDFSFNKRQPYALQFTRQLAKFPLSWHTEPKISSCCCFSPDSAQKKIISKWKIYKSEKFPKIRLSWRQISLSRKLKFTKKPTARCSSCHSGRETKPSVPVSVKRPARRRGTPCRLQTSNNFKS